jgi:hypothetical protein
MIIMSWLSMVWRLIFLIFQVHYWI